MVVHRECEPNMTVALQKYWDFLSLFDVISQRSKLVNAATSLEIAPLRPHSNLVDKTEVEDEIIF